MKPSELFDLTGKVAIVTGGGVGIGRQMAQGLAEAGADIVLCARNGERCEKAAEELRAELGVRALGLRCDVREQAEIDEVVRRTVDELGRVDVLLNNAGTSWGASPEDVPLDGWQKVIDVNLTGAFQFAQAVGRETIGPYTASKGALKMLTRAMCADWARHGIQANGIGPGYFRTEINAALQEDPEFNAWLLGRVPAGRWGEPSELAGAVVFLASAASDFVNGQILYVDGGMLAVL